MMNNIIYAAVQNDVILSCHDTREEAEARISEEKAKDFISIVMRKKLRKIFKKTGNVALHKYEVITIVDRKEISI